MSNLQLYPEYKDSGLSWLGDIPSHWICLPHRALFEEVKEQGHVNEELLSVTISRGVVRQEDLLKDTSKKDSSNQDKSKYKLVEPGDIAYNKMRAWQGAAGVSRYRGIVSPAYIVVRLRTDQNPEYFHYLFRTPGFAKEAERWSYGITSDQWSLRPQHFKMIYSCLPPRSEQDAIVRFLHEHDKKVRRFIRNRRSLIEVLNEQKQAIINRAVTRGLDPDVSLKPSGIDWLGGIPEHWEVSKNKSVYSERREIGSEELPILSVSIHHGVSTEEQSEKENLRAKIRIQDREKYLRVYPNDIAFNMMRAWQGGIGVVRVHGMVSPAYIVAKPKREIHSRFVELLFRTPQFIQEMDRNSIGITDFRKRLYWEQYKNLSIVLPPIEEQQSIVDHVEKEVAPIDKTISRTEREIDLIREYRTRLISDVVTGKVDVRHLAPAPGSENLEETVEALGPLDNEAGEIDEDAFAGKVDV